MCGRHAVSDRTSLKIAGCDPADCLVPFPNRRRTGHHGRMRSLRAAVAALLVFLTVTAASTGGSAAGAVAGELRLDQVGYLPGQASVLLMTSAPVHGVAIRVRTPAGAVVASGATGASLGRWNAAFPDVYRVSFPTLRTPGSYSVETGPAVSATKVRLRIGTAEQLYVSPLDATVAFLRNQRDGADVVAGPLDRQPAHLVDAHATVYAPPTYNDDDLLVGGLHAIGGPVDASGGWFDAGDYLKLVQTASYTDALLFVAGRAHPGDAALRAEAMHGLDWLGKMWDDSAARSTTRSASVTATGRASPATTTCGGCPRPTTRST